MLVQLGISRYRHYQYRPVWSRHVELSDILTSADFRHSITVGLPKHLVFIYLVRMCLKSKLLIQIQTLLLWKSWIPDTCLDFRHLTCLKTKQTKFWIQDNFGFKTFAAQYLGDLKSRLVHISNGPKLSKSQTINIWILFCHDCSIE